MESLIIILETFYCLLQPPALTQSLSPSWRRQFKEILDQPGLEGAEGFDKDPAEQISHWEKPKGSPAMLTRAIAFVRGTGMRFPGGAIVCLVQGSGMGAWARSVPGSSLCFPWHFGRKSSTRGVITAAAPKGRELHSHKRLRQGALGRGRTRLWECSEQEF